jgi:hypothetical protein
VEDVAEVEEEEEEAEVFTGVAWVVLLVVDVVRTGVVGGGACCLFSGFLSLNKPRKKSIFV